MKNLLLPLLLVFGFLTSYSQVAFEKGDFDINVGIGFPNTTHTAIDIGSALAGSSSDNGSSTPFYNANFSYGIVENIGIGAYVGYFESDNEIISTASALGGLLGPILGPGFDVDQFAGNTEYSVFSIGGRLEVHRNILNIKKLDTYASTWLGYNIVSDDTTVDVSDSNAIDGIANLLLDQTNFPTITYEVNAGAKYDLSDNVAIFGEAGFGRFAVNAGLTFHIKRNTPRDRERETPDARDF